MLLMGMMVSVLDAYILTLIASRFCDARWKVLVARLSFIVILSGSITVISAFVMDMGIQILIKFFVVLALLFLYYRKKLGVFLTFAIWNVLLVFCESIIAVILSLVTGTHLTSIITDDNTITVIVALASKMLECIVVYLILRRMEKDALSKSFGFYQLLFIILTLLMIIHVFILYNYTLNSQSISKGFMNYLTLFIVVYFTFMMYLLYRFMGIARKQEEQALIDFKIHLLEEHTKESKAVQEHLTHLGHDYRFHLQRLKGLMEQNLNQEANEYYEEITEHFERIHTYYIENHLILSVLFMQMVNKAKREGVDFVCDVPNVIEFVGNESEMNAILSNLLENAFQAVEDLVHDKWIRVEVKNVNQNLMIMVENPLEGQEDTLKVKGHGHGLKSVERIVKGYGGAMAIEKNSIMFTVNIIMPSS